MPHKNAEARREYQRKRYKENPERQKKYQIKWEAKNKDRVEAYRKRWNKEDKLAHPEKWKERNFRTTLQGHGVTVEWYEQQLQKQGGLCAICRKPEVQSNVPNGRPMRLAIDHAHHGKKQVRGLLCVRCNTSMARLEEVEGWTEAALTYLHEYK